MQETNADAEAITHIVQEWLQRGVQDDLDAHVAQLRKLNLPIVPSCSDQGG